MFCEEKIRTHVVVLWPGEARFHGLRVTVFAHCRLRALRCLLTCAGATRWCSLSFDVAPQTLVLLTLRWKLQLQHILRCVCILCGAGCWVIRWSSIYLHAKSIPSSSTAASASTSGARQSLSAGASRGARCSLACKRSNSACTMLRFTKRVMLPICLTIHWYTDYMVWAILENVIDQQNGGYNAVKRVTVAYRESTISRAERQSTEYVVLVLICIALYHSLLICISKIPKLL